MNAAQAVLGAPSHLPTFIEEMSGFQFTMFLVLIVVLAYTIYFTALFAAVRRSDGKDRRPDWLVPPTEKVAMQRIAEKRVQEQGLSNSEKKSR
eukprot:CFRG6821T1